MKNLKNQNFIRFSGPVLLSKEKEILKLASQRPIFVVIQGEWAMSDAQKSSKSSVHLIAIMYM